MSEQVLYSEQAVQQASQSLVSLGSPLSGKKHSIRSHILPLVRMPKLDNLQNVQEPKMSPENPRRHHRQYLRINNQNSQIGLNTDKEIIKRLQCTSEDLFEDQKVRDLVGEGASKIFYSTFKNIGRIREQNSFLNVQNSVQTNILARTEQLKLIPCKMGLVKSKGEKNQLNIQYQKYGDRYIEVLSEGLRTLPVITEFNLNQNRIQENGASLIMPLISKQARSIELLSNQIGKRGLDPMLSILTSQQCKIQVLNLEDNRLGDGSIIELCKSVSKNASLEKLNISRNQITTQAYPHIKQMIDQNDSLIELYLHWNSIKGIGGAEIFKSLTTNKNIRVLDFSYNLLGCTPGLMAAVLKDCFEQNKALLHLDLSTNGFNQADCISIAESIKANRTIYGFHFAGNYGYVDTKGFLILENDSRNMSSIHVDTRIQGVSEHPKPYSKTARFEKVRDTCWICDGWQAATFNWIPERSGSAVDEPIFIHFDYEGYEATFLGKQDSQGNFSTHRMVPAGKLDYFYTANQLQQASLTDPIKTHNDKFRVTISIADQTTYAILDETNYQLIPKVSNVITDWDPAFDVLPRTPDPIYIPAKRRKVKRVWTYPISIWAPKYKFETEEMLRKCFEKDWSCCKIHKFVKKPEEQEAIKEMLWQSYKPIKETYKFYGSINPSGDVFSISQNPMSELMNQCELIDNKILKLADVDLKFIATCSASAADWKGNYRNPERSIVRYQLMEFLVRIAEDKYVRPNPGVNMITATRQVLDQCLPHLTTFDAHKWRMERYYIEQCDDCLKKYKNIIDYVYSRNSSKKVKPGQPPFMCLDELKDVCNRLQLYDENFVDRDVNMAFNMGMMIQIDELESDRIFQMQPIEFMEALARICEKYSPPAVGKEAENMTYEQRFAQPLYYKIEAMVLRILNMLVDDETKKNIKIPVVSMFDVEEQDEFY